MSATQQLTTKKISELATATTPLTGAELFAIQQGGAARKLTVETLQSLIETVDWSDITGKPTFATVATSGSYNDLTNKPTLATVATSGSYNDLTNKPTLNTGTVTSVRVQATSPVQSSTNTAQTSTLNTTISLADGYGDTKNPYASKTKNYVLAAPSSTNGTPSFRALVANDIPSLTKSKISDFPSIPTKTSDLTNDSGYLTSAVTSFNGSTGAVTYTAPVTSVNGSTGAVTLSIPSATSDLTNDSGFTTNTGTVTSVRVQATSPVQSSTSTAQSATLNTTISLADGYGDTKNPYASKTKNYVLASPSSANGTPSFRALVADDIPSLTKSKISDFPTIPTKTSDLTNDSGFLTSAVTSFNGSTGAVTYTAPVTSVNGATGAVTGLQTTSNLVTSLSASSTDAQYASAKCVYNLVGDIETLLASI